MAYTLEQLSADCHAAMAADNGPAGREKVRDYISVACGDSALLQSILKIRGKKNVSYSMRTQSLIFVF